MLLAHIPVSLNPFQGLTICCIFVPKYLIKYSKNTQKDQNLVFKTDYHLNAGQSITEGSERSILQYFRASLSYHSSLRPVVVHFWVAYTGCVKLYTHAYLHIRRHAPDYI